MNSLLTKTATLLKVLLGAFFVFSAVAKFIDIDRLNIYVYSFGILSFNLSVLASWLLITTEFVLGAALLTNRWHRLACVGNVVLLMLFSMFLCYAILSGRTDSCHCLGEMFPFDPVQSLLKNAALLLVLLFVWKYASPSARIRFWVPVVVMLAMAGLVYLSGRMGWLTMTFFDLQYSLTLLACVLVPAVLLTTKWFSRWWSVALLVLSPLVAIFVLSVAANWIHSDTDEMLDQEMLSKVISSEGSLADCQIDEGRKVVCIFSRTCSYCQMASQKVSMIQQRNNLDASLFVTIFPGEDTIGIADFYAPDAVRYDEHLLSADTCLYITRGQVPLVMLVNEGRVEAAFTHSDVSEAAIVDFLQQ